MNCFKGISSGVPMNGGIECISRVSNLLILLIRVGYARSTDIGAGGLSGEGGLMCLCLIYTCIKEAVRVLQACQSHSTLRQSILSMSINNIHPIGTS